MILGRWTSLGLVLVGAGCLVGIYGTLKHNPAAAAGGAPLAQPILVVAQPAPVHSTRAPRAMPADSLEVAPVEAASDGADDADGVEPRNMVGSGMVVNSSPAAGWMRRLNIARELLREGAEQSARQTFERIIGEAQICRAYQYALVDLAAVELYRGRVESTRQLLDEARRSDAVLPLDRLTAERINALRVDLVVQTAALPGPDTF